MMNSWLELRDGRIYRLEGNTTLGRHKDNDLVLADPSVSRHHALLMGEFGGFSISDLHSVNGTYVNQVPVTRPALLMDGDQVRLGDLTLHYRCPRLEERGRAATDSDPTRRLGNLTERICWLLLADVVDYSGLIANLGGRAALERLQTWIGGLQPLIEGHGGTLNSCVGDALFAWWPADPSTPERVRAALADLEAWRLDSPVQYRLVIHQGSVLVSFGERGEELSGREVNFLFRAEKLAKGFRVPVLFSEAAATPLGLAGEAHYLGNSPVDGIEGQFRFFSSHQPSP